MQAFQAGASHLPFVWPQGQLVEPWGAQDASRHLRARAGRGCC